jgi:predicted DNA-binding antitoxin AbrB/MazE fold protein
LQEMQQIKVQVRNGHLVPLEPTDLPEGSELTVAIVEDDLDDEKRAARDRKIDQAFADLEAGKGIPGHVVMAKLRGRV